MDSISSVSAAPGLAPASVAGESISPRRHWNARLELEFAHLDGRTRLARSSHEGPLRVQRLFHPDPDGKAHCYLLHPPGGVVLGDELRIDARLRSGKALLTTPSAGRFYSVDGHTSRQIQRVSLGAEQGLLEWLPQETILFNGANATLGTRLELGADAGLAFWDVVVLGRPASGERFTEGAFGQQLQLYRAKRLVFTENLMLRAGDPVHRSRLALNDASTLGIAIFSATAPRELLASWPEDAQRRDPDGAYVATQRGEFLIARYRGEDAQRCRAAFADLWKTVTQARDGETPETPRIWHT